MFGQQDTNARNQGLGPSSYLLQVRKSSRRRMAIDSQEEGKAVQYKSLIKQSRLLLVSP